jgi:hypothetical protein
MDLRYTTINKDLDSILMNEIISEVISSKEVEIANELPTGQLSHIVIKGTKIPVGYIGNDSYELVNVGDLRLLEFHQHLINIYNKAWWKSISLIVSGLN